MTLNAKIRTGLFVAVAITALAGTAILLGEMQQARRDAGTETPIVIGGPFQLTDQNGNPFSSDSLKGKPYLVFFGFTHCPDICPTTLQELTTHLKDLGPQAKDLVALFITVDPARDTPENMASYLSSFDSRIIGLTGTQDEIKKVTKLYRAFVEKVETDDGDYTMNHTASVYLFDRKGNLVSTLNWQEPASARQAKLEKLLTR